MAIYTAKRAHAQLKVAAQQARLELLPPTNLPSMNASPLANMVHCPGSQLPKHITLLGSTTSWLTSDQCTAAAQVPKLYFSFLFQTFYKCYLFFFFDKG
jgi:hypothetical protein